jgi:hypothetical protein
MCPALWADSRVRKPSLEISIHEGSSARHLLSAMMWKIRPVGSFAIALLAARRVVECRFVRHRLVKHRLADLVLFARPISQIDQAAPFAAKREVRVSFRVGRLAANGAWPCHRAQHTANITPAQPSPRKRLASVRESETDLRPLRQAQWRSPLLEPRTSPRGRSDRSLSIRSLRSSQSFLPGAIHLRRSHPQIP